MSAARGLAVHVGAAVVLAAATVSLLLTAVGPATEAGASLPPELVSFEQKAEALNVNSIRFAASFEEDLDLKTKSVSLPLHLIIDGGGEASALPRRAVIHFRGLGKGIEVCVVGRKTYVHRPGYAASDGGRPWAMETEGLLSRWDGIDPYGLTSGLMASLLTGAADGGDQAIQGSGSFAQLNGVLAEAQSVTDVGPEIVNGQQAIEFCAALDPKTLLSKLSTKTLARLRKYTKATGLKPATMLCVFFASTNGLPVRTNWDLRLGELNIAESVDIVATEIPVVVQAPPAAKTIPERRLKQLERMRRKGDHTTTSAFTKIKIPPPPAVKRAGGAQLHAFVAGRSVAVSAGCEACHKFGKSGNPGPGPPLTYIGSKLTAADIRQALLHPKQPMPSFAHLGSKKLHDLVRFLALLKR